MKMHWFWFVSLVLLASCSVNPMDSPEELVESEASSEDYYLDSTFDWGDFNEGDFERGFSRILFQVFLKESNH